MRIEFLGTAGAITTPQPFCQCSVCEEARAKGVPYTRTGPSIFVHGPDVLIDTPEEIKGQLNRAGITRVAAAFYSHWHPDHVMGRRLWESNVRNWRSHPIETELTDIYLPQQVAEDMRVTLGSWDHLTYLQSLNVVRLNEMKDGDEVSLSGVRFTPFRVSEKYVYAFLLEEGEKLVLIAPDELFRWEVPGELRGILDLAILPMGICELNPFNEHRIIAEDHPVLNSEATFHQTLNMVRTLKAKRTILTHIEEPDRLSYDDYVRLEQQLQEEGLNVTFAFDTMAVDV